MNRSSQWRDRGRGAAMIDGLSRPRERMIEDNKMIHARAPEFDGYNDATKDPNDETGQFERR